MKRMTQQEVFDVVAKHLLTQGRRSTDGIIDCAYRGEGGLKCAIGVLIPDDVYSPEMEGTSVYGLMRQHPAVLRLFKEGCLGILEALQGVHDRREPEDWRDELRGVASIFCLSTSALNGAK